MSEERQITKSRGLDIFLGVLAGLLVLLMGLFGFTILSENSVLNNDLFLGIFVAAFAMLAASLPLLFRWSRRAFTLGYCWMLAVQCPLLGWLIWQMCRERDAIIGLLSLLTLFSSKPQAPRDATTGWVAASPMFIGLTIAFLICLWTVIRVRGNRA